MRTSNFGKGRRVAGLFRLCLGIIVSLTLAVGGMALNTRPVQAVLGITPAAWISPPLPECVPFVGPTFAYTNFECSNPPTNVEFWTVGTVPTWVHLDKITGVLSGCPDAGSAGIYNFDVICTELCNAGCPLPGCLLPCLCPDTSSSIPPANVTLIVVANFPLCVTDIIPTFYPVAWENMPFNMTLSAIGGVGTYNWTATGLPVNLTVTDPANGVISGTPAPGTCGTYTVTATVTDAGTCPSLGCCPDVSRPFTLIVDCYANYAMAIYATYAYYDFTVEIGPGLTVGQTKVVIDGIQEATLGGNQSETFTTQQGQSHSVTVDQTIPGLDPKTRFAVKGSNEIMVSEANTIAYFDYAQEVLVETGSDPSGISQPRGTGYYAIGDYFSTTTASPVNSDNQNGIKYLFRAWSLPDGSTNPNRDLVFTVDRAGKATALYDTYYLLQLKSDYPPVAESQWELKGSTANYDLALQVVPIPNFWGVIGGKMKPINDSGTHLMDGPYTQKIMWSNDYTVPIIVIVITLLVIAGVGYFVYRRRGGPPTRTTTPTTKAPAPKTKRRRAPSKAEASHPATRATAKRASSKAKKPAAK